ncbi:hypothetical protein M0R45_006785 [Rubus argutus]|uniref:Aquaporin SIP2-1 n=1 Tax=Rubus argutus TaxID=59490 RepID=A0AAW1YS63_RUBAR
MQRESWESSVVAAAELGFGLDYRWQSCGREDEGTGCEQFPSGLLNCSSSKARTRVVAVMDGAGDGVMVIGSVAGVRLITEIFPEIGLGPRLNVDIHRGALTEGLLTFAIVTISLGLSRKIPGSFFMKTWISSVSKLTLHILGSDLTGGCMNPASVMGWAYARGDHITKEHILVYWLAPIEATLLAVWTCRLLVPPLKEDKKAKAE